jgi:hypothetical protein
MVIPKPQVSVTSTAADKPTDREADSRCLSPLRRKTSELEGEPTKGSKRSQDYVHRQPSISTSAKAIGESDDVAPDTALLPTQI